MVTTMIINGRTIAQNMMDNMSKKLLDKKVCFVLFGNDPANLQFIRIKTRTAEKIGITVILEHYIDDVDTQVACQRVRDICVRGYDGVVIQLPLPAGLDTQVILDTVPVDQDIDVLSTDNYALFQEGKTAMIPPVATAVWEILQSSHISLNDKNIVMVGYGNLVGKPVSDLLTREGIPHRVIDQDTPAPLRDQYLKHADVIISGAGVPHMITPDMVQPGVVLIDAGTSEQSGELVGDIHPDCAGIAGYMTPVPGGVGPVTVACVYRNLIKY